MGLNRLSDAEYEAKLDELNNLAGIVNMPTLPKLYVGAAKWKPDKMPESLRDILELERQYRQRIVKPDIDYTKIGRSLTRNHWNVRAMSLAGLAGTGITWGDGDLNIKNIVGTVQSATNPMTGYGGWDYNVSYGSDVYGITIGTDGTAIAMDDYGCITKILHGDAAGEMRYWDIFILPHSYDAGTKSFTKEYVRYFTNHSGNPITVREMSPCNGWRYASSYYFGYSARDLLSPALAIADHELIRCMYTLTWDFSAID
jgi:hypothetical protein